MPGREKPIISYELINLQTTDEGYATYIMITVIIGWHIDRLKELILRRSGTVTECFRQYVVQDGFLDCLSITNICLLRSGQLMSKSTEVRIPGLL